MDFETHCGGGEHGIPPPSAPPPRPRCAVTSAASPALFLFVLARLGENGCAREVVRCVRLCRDTLTNAQLWERVVDLPHAVVGHKDADHRTMRLIHCAEAGDLGRVRETLGRGAGVNVRDAYEETALHRASRGGHLSVVRELLDRGADVDARDFRGGTALMGASFGGHAAMVLELVARGAEVNAQNKYGWSALMYAAHRGHDDAARVLLAAPGVDINRGTHGRTALTWARAAGHATVGALLEAAGAH